ncbi:tetraacyldisaccharide 4'-kinase [Planctomicrobium sp. SH664]|uniref:tetraacyldisaccharide 4'-kinase n=1 Tax=Planctomicrobium sp. SH664 TaxID=3448125 RepID=UPI003F5C6246
MTERDLLEIISGRRQSLSASALRGALALAAGPYRWGADLKNWLYDRQWLSAAAAPVPVFSVGNLTTGGTGKTPVVAWLVRQLIQDGLRPAIISRGYRSLETGENDEKRLLDQLCAGVPHVQSRDRVRAVRDLLNQTPVDAIVLDDAFQHRRLQRDLDLVLIDALNPWGFGRLLPRGLLREAPRHLRRASVVLLTRCDLVGAEAREQLQREVQRWTSAPVIESGFTLKRFINTAGETIVPRELSNASVLAFCGIGNPAGFRQTLSRVGIELADQAFRTFPDHYHYTSDDLKSLAEWGEEQQATGFLTTRKDLVKLAGPQLGRLPLWGADIELDFLSSADPLLHRMQQALQRPSGSSLTANPR